MKKFYILFLLILFGCSQESFRNIPLFHANSEYDVEYNEKCMNVRMFKIFQVSESGNALAWIDGNPVNAVVLLTPMPGIEFYDDMILTLSDSRCAVQSGVYRYETKNEIVKTVPKIEYGYKYTASSAEEEAERFYELVEGLRYKCKLSLNGDNKYNTKDNRNKCDCSADFIRDSLLISEQEFYDTYESIKKKMEKKCGRMPNGFWD